MARIQAPAVRPGQIWEDNSPRRAGRTLLIESVTQDRVVAKTLTATTASSSSKVGKTRVIRLSRMRPNADGYRMVSEAPTV